MNNRLGFIDFLSLFYSILILVFISIFIILNLTSLLSLLPPSCMVAPTRELANITLSSTAMANISNNLTPNQDIDMVVNPLDNLFDIGNNFDEVRSCSLALSVHKPRSPSISLSECSEEYHIHVKRESNRMNEDKPVTSIGSIQIEYASQVGQNGQVSKTTDITNNMCQQCVPSEDPASSSTSGNSAFNIQLNYNINQTLDLEEWDSNFHAISLHGSIEHLVSDVKNIKDSLCCSNYSLEQHS